MLDDTHLQLAVQAVASADALLIAAGAGMGVDSGLPDFRGDQGFWKAYPPYQKLGLRFTALANPQWFATDPALAWGFYGHRLNLYRAALPHEGFRILQSWARRMKYGAFVFTRSRRGRDFRGRCDHARPRTPAEMLPVRSTGAAQYSHVWRLGMGRHPHTCPVDAVK